MNTNETDIVKLNLNDTFYDWYLRTNQIIDYVNPINVYDVLVGNGLSESRTGTPGTVELSVATDSTLYGITTLVNTDGSSLVVLDYSSLSIGTVENTSIFSFQAADSQIYKVEASDILPPDLNGDHTFSGAITVGDLTVSDGNITLIADTSTNGENAGLYVTGAETETVFFTYDIETSAWYSSNNLGITNGTGFVTNAAGDAVYPFIASETQAQVDLQLQSTVSGTPERFSVYAEFDATNTLTFSHYSNGSLVSDILELTSTGTNGSSVVVKDTITITDVLNSTPFSQSPAVETVPVTDSTDGFLNDFVNRVVLPNNVGNPAAAGDFVYVNGSGEATPADATTLSHTYQVGIVESVDGSDVTIITSGSFGGVLSALTPGDIYYLAETAGDVTNTNPQDDTNGIIGKPVFIATSATSGILIPDFTNLGGGGTTVVGGSGLEDAFSTIVVLDEAGGSLRTYNATGSDSIILQEGSNITFTAGIEPDKITISATSNVPDPGTADAYSILTSDSTSSFVYTGVGESSVVGRVTNGEVASIALTQGTILGRGSDTNDNGVEALTPTQVLDILGFSGNSFLKNVVFLDDIGSTVYEYPDTDDGETLTIRAGNNITFEKVAGTFYISAADTTTTDMVSPGGGGSLQIAIEGAASYSTVENLIFDNGTDAGEYISFSMDKPSGGATATIRATPTSFYFPVRADAGSGNHIAGNTFRIVGDGLNISTSYSSTGTTEQFTINLSDSIEIANILARSNQTSLTLNIAGREAEGSRSFIFEDAAAATRNTDAGGIASDSQVIIKAWDSQSNFNSTARVTSTLAHEYCVSMVADTTDSTTSATYSLPFRFFEILVDRLTVDNLTVATAAKTTEYLGTVVGFYSDSNPDKLYTSNDIVTVRYATDTATAFPTGVDGILLQFRDDADADSSTQSSAIFRPSKSFIVANGNEIPYNTFVISDHLTFGSHSDSTLHSPVLSRGASGTLNISNLATASTELSITANGSGQFDVGIESGTGGYSYLNFINGSDNYYLRLSSDSILKTNSLVLLNDTSGGITLDISTDFTPSDTGKIMMITSVDTNGMATVEPTYVIKPYGNGSTVGTDPINTLYYVV